MLKDLEEKFETCISNLLPELTTIVVLPADIKDLAIAIGILTEKLMLIRRDGHSIDKSYHPPKPLETGPEVSHI